ncbi:MAG TPA: VOC family protein [Bryobacteraceae bacterium]
MPVKPIPEGHNSVTPYLVVPGVVKLIDFMKRAFGAQEVMPPALDPKGSVMHAEVRVGDSMIMMAEPGQHCPAMPAALMLYVTDCDAVYRKAIEAGAVSLNEPADQFYGDRSAGITDPSGNRWWIGTHKEDVAPDEMKRRMREVMAKQTGHASA